jgi:major membrane immunogen (membrane-anchored lipoprotein)
MIFFDRSIDSSQGKILKYKAEFQGDSGHFKGSVPAENHNK